MAGKKLNLPSRFHFSLIHCEGSFGDMVAGCGSCRLKLEYYFFCKWKRVLIFLVGCSFFCDMVCFIILIFLLTCFIACDIGQRMKDT